MHNEAPATHRNWTILGILNWTTAYFSSHDVEAPRASAEIILAHVLRVNRIDLYTNYDKPLTGDELAAYKRLIKRRVGREPVAYITGTKGFWSMDLHVTDKCLIPRPETEILVQEALAFLPEDSIGPPMKILEFGTGSGAVVIALALERPGHLFFASDCFTEALWVARKNATEHHLMDQILFFAGDWTEPLKIESRFDMIISNPPYIPTSEITHLQLEISRFEPAAALDGGMDGLSCIRRIVGSVRNHLAPGGRLLLEIGYDQKTKVADIIRSVGGYEDIAFVRDYGGHYRVVSAKKN
ncbi:MAG: peptide chain release factor N(5)-glutamine methyltransferase [Desulfobacterales bacterium]